MIRLASVCSLFMSIRISFTIQRERIDEKGNYIPYYSYSVISMCESTPKLEELYHVFKSSPMRKYYMPLNFTTYHMTVFNIWNQMEKFYTYQKDSFGREPARNLPSMNKVMKPILFKIGDKLKEFVELESIIVSNLKIKRKKPGHGAMSMSVDIVSPEQKRQIKDFRSWCAENLDKSDSKLRFHITLGYVYKTIEEDLEPAILDLERWLKNNIPYLVVRKPIPVVFTAIDSINPYIEFFQKDDKGMIMELAYFFQGLIFLITTNKSVFFVFISFIAFLTICRRKCKRLMSFMFSR